jgi:uncharacterized repeat protein (TIGR01451 family)
MNPLLPFVGPSYNLDSRPHSVQRVVNMMPVPLEPGNERTGWVFKDVPGLTQFLAPYLGITKTQADAALYTTQTQTYTVVATNGGPEAADGELITDDLPAAFTFVSCTIAYAGSATGPASATEAELLAGVAVTTWPVGGTVTLTITGTFATAGSIENTAEVGTVSDSVTTVVTELPTGFIGITEGSATDEDGGATVVPHADVIAGDALVLIVVRQVSGAFVIDPGWDLIHTGQDSSGGLRVESYGRLANGTATDTATYTVSAGPTMYVMFAFRVPDDSHFPAGMLNAGSVDVTSGLSGAGSCNVNAVTKVDTGVLDRFAVIVGFFESTYPLGVGMELTAPPTGYTEAGNQTMGFEITGTPFYCQMMGCYRTYNGTGEDAGAFTVAPSGDVGGGGTGAIAMVITYAP